jgi:hypothetical protein
MNDRLVHARRANGEIVRYNRAGKWYVEWLDTGKRTQLTIRDAARMALFWARNDGGIVYRGLPGGTAFDRLTE